MAGFEDIIGYDNVKEQLKEAIASNKISHAYIFNGPKGSGKKMLAKAFAMMLQCENKGEDACLTCHSCKQALSDNHPDIKWVKHIKPTSIGVEDVRDSLVGDVMIKPYNGKYKIYIIEEANLMTVQAQNAILKTIEEPPEYVVVILLTRNADEMLPTILSRCVRLDLRPIKSDIIVNYLMKKYEIPDYKARFCEEFAQGNIGRAINLATSDEFNRMREDVLMVLRYGHEMQIPDIVEAIKTATNYKLTIGDYIDFCVLWYRDILMYKATQDPNNVMYKEQISDIRKQAGAISYEGAKNILDALDKAKVRLSANVNFDLVLELMLLAIKENTKL